MCDEAPVELFNSRYPAVPSPFSGYSRPCCESSSHLCQSSRGSGTVTAATTAVASLYVQGAP